MGSGRGPGAHRVSPSAASRDPRVGARTGPADLVGRRRGQSSFTAGELRGVGVPTASSVDRTAPIVNRIKRSHQRIEPSGYTTPPVGLPQLAGVVTRRTPDDTGHPAGAHQMGTTSGLPTADATPAPAAFDLERLTDDVVARLDDRLTAHRERLGHAF